MARDHRTKTSFVFHRQTTSERAPAPGRAGEAGTNPAQTEPERGNQTPAVSPCGASLGRSVPGSGSWDLHPRCCKKSRSQEQDEGAGPPNQHTLMGSSDSPTKLL